MTGKLRIWPDNSAFWPDIVCWPAIISRPESYTVLIYIINSFEYGHWSASQSSLCGFFILRSVLVRMTGWHVGIFTRVYIHMILLQLGPFVFSGQQLQGPNSLTYKTRTFLYTAATQSKHTQDVFLYIASMPSKGPKAEELGGFPRNIENITYFLCLYWVAVKNISNKVL
jgi:hypothetical protein